QVDGHRADLVGRKASQALAAYRGIGEVGVPEVNEVADMVLAHRVKAGGRRELGSVTQSLPSASRAWRSSQRPHPDPPPAAGGRDWPDLILFDSRDTVGLRESSDHGGR